MKKRTFTIRKSVVISPFRKGGNLIFPPFIKGEQGGFILRGILALVFLLSFSSLTFAAFSANSAGSTGAAFLKLGAGARPAALGDAFTGVADDINALYWNAAGLSTLKKNEFLAVRAQMFQDLQYNVFAYAHPTKSWGTFAIGLNNLNISNIEQRSGDTDSPDSTFGSNDTAYTLGYAVKVPFFFDQGVRLGAGFKYIRETLAGTAATAIAGDIGALYRFDNMPLTLGLSLLNMGTQPQFVNTADSLPLTIKIGSSYRLGERWGVSGGSTEDGRKGGLLMALDVSLPKDNDPSVKMGTEFTSLFSGDMSASIRAAGSQVGRTGQVDGSTFETSAGLGFTFKYFTFDFAWIPFRNLGNTYRYSIKVRF